MRHLPLPLSEHMTSAGQVSLAVVVVDWMVYVTITTVITRNEYSHRMQTNTGNSSSNGCDRGEGVDRRRRRRTQCQQWLARESSSARIFWLRYIQMKPSWNCNQITASSRAPVTGNTDERTHALAVEDRFQLSRAGSLDRSTLA